MKTTFTPQKWIYFLALGLMVLGHSIKMNAQSQSLPYFTTWDNAAQKAGWTLHQLKSTKFFTWGYSATDTPNFISHDYPVSNDNGDTVEDWFVSPPLNVTGKSAVSLSANVYVIQGNLPSDYFGVWYSKKSADPKSGDFKELANLTSFSSTAFTNWHDTSGILINDSGSAVYIAFKYSESLNWFTVGVRNVNVKAAHNSGIENPGNISKPEINIYPNPSHGSFSLQLPASRISENSVIEIYDLTGRKLVQMESKGKVDNRIDAQMLNPGMYECRITSNSGEVYVGKLVVE